MRVLALIAIVGALAAQPAFACSLGPGYEAFGAGLTLSRPTMMLAPAPDVTVETIERGYDDGDGGSCSDAGVLVLTVPSDALGYRFELVAGSLEEDVFPSGYVRTRERGRLRFVWLDGEHDWQESIDVLLKITTLSATGVVSEPTLLRIRHSGGASARR
jgi:hypothetical protein